MTTPCEFTVEIDGDDACYILIEEPAPPESADVLVPDLEIAIENPAPESDDSPPPVIESVAIAEKGDKGDPGANGVGVSTADVVASENLNAFDFVTAGGARADSDNLAHLGHIAGMTPEAVLSGFVAHLVSMGEVTNSGWSWAANAKLFLNGTGLSTVAPSTGFSQIVALSRNSDTVIIQLGDPVRL
jgi:hypothetical protein